MLMNKKNKEHNNINKVWNKQEIKLEVSYIFLYRIKWRAWKIKISKNKKWKIEYGKN
jgi:hypothetical protein